MEKSKNILFKSTKSNSYQHLRELRMGELVKRKLNDALQYAKLDSSLLNHLSITEVKISPGYAIAKVFITSLNLDVAKEKVALLNSKKKQIRYALTHCIKLKYIPDLIFVVDDTFEKANHINELLANKTVKEDLNR